METRVSKPKVSTGYKMKKTLNVPVKNLTDPTQAEPHTYNQCKDK